MPILVDYSQVFISNLMRQPDVHEKGVDEGLVRHMVLNSLRFYKNSYGVEHGELVICCDNRHNWRKKFFPHYKANRKTLREESDVDWNEVFGTLNKVKDELTETFPYMVLEVETAEADDIIGTLCGYVANEPILIISGDKDFIQLQQFENVKQYCPVKKTYLNVSDPIRHKREHIMRGDRGDGVPNFLSDDTVFVNGGRQKPLSKKRLEYWSNYEPEIYCDYRMMYGYKRNQQLVDLDFVPDDLKDEILYKYDHYELNDRDGLLGYFIKHKLKQLMENLNEF